MSDIPPSWLECALGHVIDYGKTIKAEPNEIPSDAWVLELEDIEKDTSRILNRLTFQERQSKSTKNRFVTGDVLYGKLRPYLNKVVRATSNGYCTTEILPLSPTEAVNGDYLFYWLKHPRFLDYVTGVSHGLNMPRLGTEAGQRAPFVLAPLNEQKRIAEKLDSLLARVDACRERLDRIPTILKRLRQSVVTAAVKGKLLDNRHSKFESEAANCASWQEERLDNLCEQDRVITYGVIKLGSDVSDGVPCLRTSNVRWLDIETEGMKRIAVSLSADYPRTILRGGEVLVNVRGTLGGVAVAEKQMAGWNVSREVAVVPVDVSRIDPTFLAYSIGSTESQQWLSRVEKGVAYTGINIEDLRNLPVRFPSISIQRHIVAMVKSLLAYADGVESRYVATRTHVSRLTSGLLSKAFRGELVPQDPNDEPAEELLSRIRHATASEVSKPREKKSGKRISKKKATETMLKRVDVQSNHLTEILRSNGPLTAEALWNLSQLEIDDFYDQLKAEEEKGLLKERRKKGDDEVRLLEVA